MKVFICHFIHGQERVAGFGLNDSLVAILTMLCKDGLSGEWEGFGWELGWGGGRGYECVKRWEEGFYH